MTRLLIIVFLNALFSVLVFAQNLESSSDTTKYLVVKNNGVEYIGFILSDDGREIHMITDNLGHLYIPKADIKLIKKVDEERHYRKGSYIGEGVFTTRYQFSTNAFTIEKGEHYSIVNLYGPEVHFALHDNLSVGIMATWIASPIALALKYSIPTRNEKLNFGVGTLIGSSAYLNQARGFGGLHWAMVTYGDRRTNITLSAGYGFVDAGNGGVDRIIPSGVYYGQYDEWNGTYYFQYPYGSRNGSGLYTGPVLGLAGVFAVNARTSFIFDFIASFATRDGVYQTVSYSNTNWMDSEYSIVSGPISYSEVTNNFVFMPGMRFQKTEKSALQVTIAGIMGSRTYRQPLSYFNTFYSGDSKLIKNNYSFPFPMLSWFFKF